MSQRTRKLKKPKKVEAPPSKRQKNLKHFPGFGYLTRSKMAESGLGNASNTPLPLTPPEPGCSIPPWNTTPRIDFRVEMEEHMGGFDDKIDEEVKRLRGMEENGGKPFDEWKDEDEEEFKYPAEKPKGELVIIESDDEVDLELEAENLKEIEAQETYDKLLQTIPKDDTNRAIMIAMRAVETRLGEKIARRYVKIDEKLKRHQYRDKEWKEEMRTKVIAMADGFATAKSIKEQLMTQANQIKELQESFAAFQLQTDHTRFEKIERGIKDLSQDLDNYREATRKAVNKNAELIQSLQRRTREKNVRAAGVEIKTGETNENAILRTFKPIWPALVLENIEFATKVFKRNFKYDPKTARGPPPKPVILVGFSTREMRDNIFFESKKQKEKLGDVIVREDLIKRDLQAKELARDQMKAAFESVPPKKSKFTYGKLVVEGNKIEITNIRSLDRIQFPEKFYRD
jgi:hypothetical protein